MASEPRWLGYPGHELLLPDVVRAEGACLYDASGTRFVDLESGVWCTPLGHGHPAVLAALREQLTQIAHTGFNYAHPVVEAAAREILALLGFEGGRCVFLCSGSEAVEYGVRAARMVVPRPLMLTFADSYFGAYGDAARREASTWHVHDWLADEDVEEIPFARVGGFLFEPGSSSGQVRFPPRALVERVAQAVRDRGGLVIANEVTTGMGRTGAWFGFQHYGLQPDIVALGKGLGNGYPVSVAALSPRAAERLTELPRYAQSHQNDPLGAAVAQAVVRALRDEDLVARARALGETFKAELEAVQARTGKIKAVRGRGLMLAVELADEPPFASAARIQRQLVGRGFVVGRRPNLPVLRLDPALNIPEADLDAFCDTLGEVLA